MQPRDSSHCTGTSTDWIKAMGIMGRTIILYLYPAEAAVDLPRLAGVAVHRRWSPLWVLVV